MGRDVKRIFTIFVLLASILMVSGCATSSELRKLSIGMDKNQVIGVLGEPIKTRASARETGTVEIWDYTFAKTVLGFPPVRDTYWIILKDSKLTQWGEENDWGTSEKAPDRVEKLIIQKQDDKKEPKFQ